VYFTRNDQVRNTNVSKATTGDQYKIIGISTETSDALTTLAIQASNAVIADLRQKHLVYIS